MNAYVGVVGADIGMCAWRVDHQHSHLHPHMHYLCPQAGKVLYMNNLSIWWQVCVQI